MNRTKFKYEYKIGSLEADWNMDDLKQAMRSIPKGEILVREQIEWNVDQMRKYLHGPCTKFIVNCFKDTGTVVTPNYVHELLRKEFLPCETKTMGGKEINIPVSSESIGRKKYIAWINAVNDWCVDAFGMGLPPAEKVD